MAERLFDLVNHCIWRGSSRSDADSFCIGKPDFTQVICCLDVMHTRTKLRTRFYKFVGVVALRSADDNDHVAFLASSTAAL